MVNSLVECRAFRGSRDAGVMAGGDVLRSESVGPGHQLAELYLVIAGDAGVGSAPAAVLVHEVVHYPVVELALHVENVVRYAQLAADRTGILYVVQRTAALVTGGQRGFVEAVQLQRDAHDVPSCAMQQQRSDGGVNPPAHSDDNPARRKILSHICSRPLIPA